MCVCVCVCVHSLEVREVVLRSMKRVAVVNPTAVVRACKCQKLPCRNARIKCKLYIRVHILSLKHVYILCVVSTDHVTISQSDPVHLVT